MSPGSTDEALRDMVDAGRARARATHPEHVRLWDALAAAAEGGKRFRPALLTAAHDALGGRNHAAAVKTGAAVELLHTAFVIHDDVIDGDDVRRGRLNVSGTFAAYASSCGATADDADTLASTAGILAGDLALAAAIRAVATCGVPPGVTDRLLDLFDEALHTTAAGELADVRLSLGIGTGSMAESLAMARQKTGAYSFALPLQAGALLAGSDEATVAGLGEAGLMLGVAFQLVDDLLGVFGDPVSTGKSTSGDLRTRKQTPLLAHAQSTPSWEQIATYVGRELDADELAEARRLLTDSGSRRYVEELAATQHDTARLVLDQLGMPANLLDDVKLGSAKLADRRAVAA